jgi:four helix bundle protein
MSQELKSRTSAFAIRVIKMTQEVRKGKTEDILVRQVIRSATSIAANYRSALRARNKPDFISRITIAEEEADETCYWLETMIAIAIFPEKRLSPLLQEAHELTAIMTATGKTAKENLKKTKIAGFRLNNDKKESSISKQDNSIESG